MKARIAFYFAAVVALVLFLAAAVPSHATQHRDPAATPENMQKTAPPATGRPASASNSANPKAHPSAGKAKKQTSSPRGSGKKPGR